MSYTGIYYISGDKGGDEVIPAPFRCKTAGEYLERFSKIIIKEPHGASGKGLWVVEDIRDDLLH